MALGAEGFTAISGRRFRRMNHRPTPKLIRWHWWSGLAAFSFRVERALGPFGGLIAPLKWSCLERAERAYPGAHVEWRPAGKCGRDN